MHVASARGDIEAARLLLAAGADPNAVGERGCTPLHEALEHKHLQVARMLIAAGASMDTTNRDGVTPRDLAKAVCLWEGDN